MTPDIAGQIWPAGQFDTLEIKVFSKKLYFIVFCQPKLKYFATCKKKWSHPINWATLYSAYATLCQMWFILAHVYFSYDHGTLNFSKDDCFLKSIRSLVAFTFE